MRISLRPWVRCVLLSLLLIPQNVHAQPKKPAPILPGDTPIHAYLARAADRLEATFPDDVPTAAAWMAKRQGYHSEYLDMLGLNPLPERTPLKPVVTGKFEGDGFTVENLQFQSRPGLYVTGNLYRPAKATGERLPAVLYVCGHSPHGRDGNKVVFQGHGVWLARHGYIALLIDTLQLGEIAGTHHGTYREQRWWWHSRGYTSAGVECWNGVRAIDYLVSRPEVDPDRIGVTGISGGGAATFWIAAADDRVKVAIPVSGMADLQCYVGQSVVDGHCDCMFLYNTYQWPWTRIAALIAHRPLLFVNSDKDPIYPMYANERVITRLERLYSKFGAGERVDAVVSVGGHDYRTDIRAAAFRFLNIHLKGDGRPVTDADEGFESTPAKPLPIDPAKLRVFPEGTAIPADAINARVDETFVPVGKPRIPESNGFAKWRDDLIAQLRKRSFRALPAQVAPATGEPPRLITPDGLTIVLEPRRMPALDPSPRWVEIVVVVDPDAPRAAAGDEKAAVYELRPRGVAPFDWTRKNPPNTVERSMVLLGETVDSGRVHDILSAAAWVRKKHGSSVTLQLRGEGKAGILAAYATLLDPTIARVVISNPPDSHMEKEAPAFLNVLRVLDIPDALGLLAPRRLTIQGASQALVDHVRAAYRAAEAGDALVVTPKTGAKP
ncbi:MAG: prolyl oligopeptidase family serine peptidase [Isosphaeraceae bacterium]